MFLISIIAFVTGIYIEAIYPVPPVVSCTLCVFFLCVVPIALRRTYRIASLMILICFALAGMVRLGIVTENRSEIRFDNTNILEPDSNDNSHTGNSSFLNDGGGRV